MYKDFIIFKIYLNKAFNITISFWEKQRKKSGFKSKVDWI